MEQAEAVSSWLFYASAVLSTVIAAIDAKAHPVWSDNLQIAFVISVVAQVVLGLALKLHFTPAGLDARTVDQLSHAFQIPLTADRTQEYYTDLDSSEALRRLAASTLENSLFSRAIALRMARSARIQVAAYFAVLVVLWLQRSTPVTVAATAAQIVFSEQVLSFWLRLEWFRGRCDQAYQHLYSLLQARPAADVFSAQAVRWFAFYEGAKWNSGVTLSARIFLQLNPSLSREWDQIVGALEIVPSAKRRAEPEEAQATSAG